MKKDTLIATFHEQVNRLGDRVALREKDFGIWKEVSWNQYAEHVKYFCLGLLALGMERGDRVGILSENCQEWLYADFAIQTAGGISVGVYSTSPPPQILYVHEHSDATFSVCGDQEQVDKVLEVKDRMPCLKKIIVIDMKGLRNYSDPDIIDFYAVEDMGREYEKNNNGLYEKLLKNINADDVAVQIYTSGTTGPPKGAMLTHKNMTAAVDALCDVVKFFETDNLVSYLPLCHVGERITSVFIPIKIGATVNFAENIETVTEALYEISPSIFLGVPRIWEKMQSSVFIKMQDKSWIKQPLYNFFIGIGDKVAEMKISGKKVPWHMVLFFQLGRFVVYRKILAQMGLLKTRVAISGAAAISPDVLKFFLSLGLHILEIYGQTEIAGISFITPPDQIRIGTVGKLLPSVEIKIAEDGEIIERSPQVFAGYFKDEDAYKKTVVSGWLYSGDVGTLDEDGYLTITDRKKDLLVTPGGKNISPQFIENKLKFSPYINEAMVVGGEGYRYPGALIQIETENVGKWAQERSIGYTTFHDLSSKTEVYDLIAKEVEKANSELSRVERIKRFILLNKELDHDDKELTATLKLRRKEMYKLYKDVITELYEKGRFA